MVIISSEVRETGVLHMYTDLISSTKIALLLIVQVFYHKLDLSFYLQEALWKIIMSTILFPNKLCEQFILILSHVELYSSINP